MASQKNKNDKQGTAALIDPIYKKFTRGVLRAISDTEFYEYFMEAVSRAENEIQFSNRKMEKAVDLNWVDRIEDALPAIQNIISNPRNIIREEELIVNAANAKKAGSDVVRHLSQHASFVEDFNKDTGDVRPAKLMQKYREDSEELYENRLVFTTMEMTYHFIRIRHEALFEAMSDEFGAKLRVETNMESATELVHMETFLHIKEKESAMDADERNAETFARISRMYRLLTVFMNSAFAKQMSKTNRVKGTIYKTNVLKKHPDYRKVANLLEYLRNYTDVGYSIRVVEQSPAISEVFQRDIYHNVLFNYMVLKGYLQDDSDRVIPARPKQKQRTLRPKFIREIVEELTDDYDLPDVEVRKVLIEELTKEQLMHEEMKERHRLVEEQRQKKKEEAERLRQEKAAEKERLRKEKEAEKERIRQVKEAEEKRLFHERMIREAEERRRSKLIRKELDWFAEHLQDQIDARNTAATKRQKEKKNFADAALLVEETERREKAQKQREEKRRQEKIEQARREEQLAAQREKERQAAERKRIQQEIQQARREEQLAKERQEQEQLRWEEEARQAELEQKKAQERQANEALQMQIAAEKIRLQPYQAELQSFFSNLELQKKARTDYEKMLADEKLRIEQQRLERIAARQAGK